MGYLLPGESITILDGQLGSVNPSNDAVMGLVVTAAVAPAGLAFATPLLITSVADAVTAGITPAYDIAQLTDAWEQISDFYTLAPGGTQLWIMVVVNTTTMASACNPAGNIVVNLLNAAGGNIKMWGISRVPAVGYTPVVTDGIDGDVFAAVVAAQTLSNNFATAQNPCRFLVGARDFQGNVGDLRDFSLGTQNRGEVVLGALTTDGHPCVGFTLGQYANRPVQRKISRVLDGDVGILEAYMSDGNTTEFYQSSWAAIAAKGYVFFRTFANMTGYYFSSDPACCPPSDDYSSIARGRVIDKAQRIVYATYILQIDNEVETDANGYLLPAVIKDFQQSVIDALTTGMAGNITAASCVISAVQNILATNLLTITKVGVTPFGYSSQIDVSLGFDNPLNND